MKNEIVALKSAARNSDNKLRSFFESSSVIHLLIDTDLRLIDFNRAAENFVQKYYGQKIHQDMMVTRFMHKDHQPGFMESYKKALNGIPCRVERIFNYDGEQIIWFLNYEPARDHDQKIIGMSFNAVDITEKVANEGKISSQYHMLKEIAYVQSHNFRKPVSNIIGLMSIFKKDGYKCSREGLKMLEKAIFQLEKEMKIIERCTKTIV